MSADKRTGILKSTVGIAFATLLSRILGLVRVMFEARVLGGGSIASAWFLAFAIPNLFRRLLGEGALGTALIPVVTSTEQESGAEQVRRDLGVVFAVLSLLLAVIVVLVSAGAWGVAEFAHTQLAHTLFPVLASERIQLTLALLSLLMPYSFFICLIGVIGAVLNTRKQFILPALGALLLNVFLISGLMWGYYTKVSGEALLPFLRMLSLLVLGSGFLQLILMLLLLWKYGRFPILCRDTFRNCAVLKQLWSLVLPNMIGGAALQISFLIDRSLAICLGPQAVPALTNVDRLIDLPIGIFAISLGSVLMASMARSAARGQLDEMSDDLFFSLRHVGFACIPMAVMVVFFQEPILRILCLGGNYTVSDLEATRMVAIFLGAGIPIFCMLKVILPVFYARKQTRFPLYSSLIAISVNIILNLLLMWNLKQGGIALATVISAALNSGILLWRLHSEGFQLHLRELLRGTLRTLLLSLMAALPLWWVYPFMRFPLSWRPIGEAPAFFAVAVCFLLFYLAGNRLLHSPEVTEMTAILRRRKNRGTEGNAKPI